MSHLLSHSLNFPLNYCTVPTTVDSRSVAVGQSEMKLRGIASSRQEKPLTLSCLNVRKPNQTWYVLALQSGWIQRCIALFKKSFWETFSKTGFIQYPHHFSRPPFCVGLSCTISRNYIEISDWNVSKCEKRYWYFCTAVPLLQNSGILNDNSAIPLHYSVDLCALAAVIHSVPGRV